MHKRLIGTLAGALCLSVAGVAVAQTADKTTNELDVKVALAKAGTKKKPKPVVFTLAIKGGVKDGGTQPATSSALDITLAKGVQIASKQWPKKDRCDYQRMVREKSTKPCPKRSKVGTGRAVAKAGSLTEVLSVSAYVLKNGNIGFYLLGRPVRLDKTLEGKVGKGGRGLKVVIPADVQEPITGLKTGIELLEVKFNAKAKVKSGGKTTKIGIVQTTGCSGGKWKFAVDNVIASGGRVKADTTVKCKK